MTIPRMLLVTAGNTGVEDAAGVDLFVNPNSCHDVRTSNRNTIVESSF